MRYYQSQSRTDNRYDENNDQEPNFNDPNIDHYDLLGVEKFASVDEIKTRYQKLVKKYHPDLAALNGNLSKEESHDRFIKIKQAYDDLINKERRKAYDSKIFSQGSMRREEDEIENSTPFAERMKNYKPPSYEEFERTILATATYHEAFAGEEEREGEHLSMIEILRTASITKRFGIIASVTLAFGVFVESILYRTEYNELAGVNEQSYLTSQDLVQYVNSTQKRFSKWFAFREDDDARDESRPKSLGDIIYDENDKNIIEKFAAMIAEKYNL